MQSPPLPGDVVRVRGRLWQVQGIRSFDACTAIRLRALDGARSSPLTVLTPFDSPETLRLATGVQSVSRRRWNAHLASAIVRAQPADALHAPSVARIELFPYQLAPAISVAIRGATRVLIADGVGLGKTIQAGLIVLELRLRHRADRVLVLTPAGLRQQWARELRRRFRLECQILDAPTLSALRSTLPVTVNPWSVPPIVISSFDFVKRPDVEPGPAEVAWDLVVVDEAHLATVGTARRSTVHRLAARALHVVLLTATPHAGDDGAYAALCEMGRVAHPRSSVCRPSYGARNSEDGDALVVFRRTRADVGMARVRRVHLHTVGLSAAERRMHASLLAYARAVWAEARDHTQPESRLAVAVLLKRALSSPNSLRRSIDHRVALLSHRPHRGPAQLALFNPCDDEPADGFDPLSVSAPGLCDPAHEVNWLRSIADDAALASQAPAKFSALVRILTRAGEPAVVFTEYRDTLIELEDRISSVVSCAVLHGGLDGQARAEALRKFARGRARVLVATDAAGEGLNLQARCRLVINLELPWNPMRLEQRIGRVDRIGQIRTVHAIHLLARDTLESRVLSLLLRRVARARLALGDLESPLGRAADTAVAEAWLTGSGLDRLWTRDEQGPDHGRNPGGVPTTAPCGAGSATRDIAAAAMQECRRTVARKALLACRVVHPTSRRATPVVTGACPVAWLEGARAHRSWLAREIGQSAGLLLVFEAWIVDPAGQLLEPFIVPIWVACRIHPRGSRRDRLAAIRGVVDEARHEAGSAAADAARQRALALGATLGGGMRHRAARMAAIAWAEAVRGQRLIQPGLFEDRALREAWRQTNRRANGWRPNESPEWNDSDDCRCAGEPVLIAVLGLLSWWRPSCSPA